MEKPSKLTAKRLVLVIAAVVVICGLALGLMVYSRNNVKEVAAEDDYGYINPDETKAETDAGIVIDGVLDEEEYQNNNWLYLHNTEGGADVDIAMTSYYGEKGMYFVYDVTERTPIYVNLSRASYLNSCIEMYLAPSTVTSLTGNSLFEIDMLATGDMTFKKSNGKGGYVNVATTNDMMAVLGATPKGGEVNTEECYGYSLELFIPWEYMDKFDLDSEAMKESFVYVDPAHITSFNYAGTDTSVDRYWYFFAQQQGASFSNVYQYFRFNGDGVLGTVPVTLEEGDHYTMAGDPTVIPGMWTTVTITPESGYAINSVLVNGEEYIKKVSYNEDGSVVLKIRGTVGGLNISASAEPVTEGNKTLSGIVYVNKVGGASLDGVEVSYTGPQGEKPVELDSKGKFELTDLAQGYYTIKVEKEGYDTVTRGIYLNRDIETEISLEYAAFSVVNGTCWLLDEQNNGILHKFGGAGVILSNDSYKKFTVETNFKYSEELAAESDGDFFLQQRQGLRIKFSNEKVWHIDILKDGDQYFVQYAKFSGDNTLFSWRIVHILSEEEIAKFTSEDGIELEVQRDGKYANVYLDGKLIAIEILDDEFEKCTAQIGFESWVSNREIMEIPYKITSGTKEALRNGFFATASGWDLTKQYDGIISLPQGGRGDITFANKYANMDLTIQVKDDQNSKDEANVYPRTDVLFVFDNGAHISFGVVSDENGAWIQSLNQADNEIDGVATQYIYRRWTSWGKLTDEEYEQYLNGGVDFRIVRIGTEISLYIGDRFVACADLTSNESGVTADMKATVTIRHYDDAGVEIEIPFDMTEDIKLVTITSVEGKYGTVATNKKNYFVGDTVILSGAGKEGYYMNGLKVNGKEVTMNWDGTYTFKATKTKYTAEGTFAKKVFKDNSGWNLLKQNEGLISLPNGGNGGPLDFYKQYTNIDLTLTVRDYDDAGNTPARTDVLFVFENGAHLSFGVVSDENGAWIQSLNQSDNEIDGVATQYIYRRWSSWGSLTEEELAAYKSGGVDFRVVRIGTEVSLYINGRFVKVADLTNNNSGVTAKTKATVCIRHYDDEGTEVQIPFTVTDDIDLVTVKSVKGKLGTVATNKKNYFVGDTVILSGAGNDGYYMNGLKVNGKAVTLNWNGTYTFTATEKTYKAEGTFVERVFNDSAEWNLLKQNEGVISLPATHDGDSGYVDFYKQYEDIDLTLTIRDYIGNYAELRTVAKFTFENGETAAFSVTCGDNTYMIQSMGDSLYGWRGHYVLTEEQVAAFQSKDGIDFRILRNGTEVLLFLDDTLVKVCDLSMNKAGEDTGITADMAANLSLRQYGNVGYTVQIPFTVSDAVPEVIDGTISLENGGRSDMALVEQRTDMDLTIKATDYADADNTAARTDVLFVFENGAHVSFGIVGDGSKYFVQSLNQTGNTDEAGNSTHYIYKRFGWHGDLTEEEAAKYTSEGVDFRLVRIGTEISLYIDGRFVTVADLTNNDSGVTADMGAQVTIRHYDDAGVKVEMPFTLTEVIDKVTITSAEDEFGTVVTNKKNYFVGDTVILSGAGAEGYYCTSLMVNGEEVTLNWDGTYTFTATENAYTVSGTFAERVFKDSAEWNLLAQNEGVISVPEGHDGDSNWVEFYDNYTDMDLTLTARDYIGNNTGTRQVVRFTFENGKTASYSITYADGEYKIQSMGDDLFGWGKHYTLSQEEIAAYQSEDGIEFRIVRAGTDVFLYLDGKRLCEARDLTVDKSGNETGITADMEATVAIRHYGNVGYAAEIPFTVTDEAEQAVLTLEENANGTIVTNWKKFLPGDTVVLSGKGNEGYYCYAIQVDGEEVTLNWNGTYTFTATDSSYTVSGSFAERVFKDSAEWNLLAQNEGVISVQEEHDGDSGWVEFYDNYTDMDLTLTARDYIGNNTETRQVVRFTFENGKTASFSVTYADGEYKIQSMGDALYGWKGHYTLSQEEIAAYQSEDGIEFRIVRTGTDILLYLDGKCLGDALDITVDKSGNATGITADMEATVAIRHYGNVGYAAEIPFTVTDEVEAVTINIAETENGTITSGRRKYLVGEEVVLTVTGDNCSDKDYENDYYYDSFTVNGEEVTVDSNGNYTFTATASTYEVTGSFAPTIFKSNEATYFDIMNQHKGVVYQKEAVADDSPWLYLVGTRVNSDMSIIVKAGEDDFDVDGTLKDTSGDRTAIAYYNGKTNAGYGILLEKNGKYYVANSGSSNQYGAFYEFTAEETTKIKEEGIELRVIRIGAEVHIYLDDKYIATKTLPFGENEATQMFIRRWDDGGVRVPIGFKFSKEVPETVTLNIAENENGTITTDCQNYLIGETVTLTVTPNEGYACASLSVNGEAVELTNGTYTFTATDASYQIEAVYGKLSIINITKPVNGMVTTDSSKYFVGDKVTLTVTPDAKYECTSLEVDGEEVELTDGTYTFTAIKTSYTVNATFTRIIFKNSTDWDVTGQFDGYLTIPSSDGDSGWVDSIDNTYGDLDLKVTLRDQNNSDDNYRAAVRLSFTNNQYVTFTVTNDHSNDDATTVYALQNMGGTILSWKYHGYELSESMVAKLTGDEGLEFRIVRVGNTVDIYLDGTYACTYDLTTSDETKSVENLTAQINMRFYGNSGKDVKIPFSISGKPEEVSVNITTPENGTITSNTAGVLVTSSAVTAFERTNYIVGENITLTVAGDNCDDTDYENDYYYSSLKVNDEEVTVDSDGNYTFTATETAYEITGSFALTVFQSNESASFDIMNQHKGVVYQKSAVSGTSPWLYMVGTYGDSDVSIIVKAGEDDFDADGNCIDSGGDRTAIRYYGTTSGKNYGYSILLQKGKYYVGHSGSANGYDNALHTFSDEETKKIKEEGIELRLVKTGTTVKVYLDDNLVATETLTSFGATDGTKLVIQRFDDGGVRVPIEYKIYTLEEK